MTLSIWCGAQPRQAPTHDLLANLHATLEPQSDHYVALVNFYPSPTTEVDLVLIKSQGIFVAELKYWPGPITHCDDQSWLLRDETDAVKTMHNPFKAVRRKYWEIKEWLRRNGDDICGRTDRSAVMNWRAARSFVVISPTLHPESLVPTDTYTKLLGYDTWLQDAQQRRQPGLDLTPEELERIPLLLRLKRYDGDSSAAVVAPKTPPPAPRSDRAVVQQKIPVQQLVARGHSLNPQLFNVQQSVVRVGRHPSNELVIDHPTIAEHHAEIRSQGEMMSVTNLSKSMGTFLALPNQPEQTVRAATLLETGVILRFGAISYTVIAS